MPSASDEYSGIHRNPLRYALSGVARVVVLSVPFLLDALREGKATLLQIAIQLMYLLVMTWLLQWLWNLVIVDVTGWSAISFMQALLIKLTFMILGVGGELKITRG